MEQKALEEDRIKKELIKMLKKASLTLREVYNNKLLSGKIDELIKKHTQL